eukprot:3935777-Rhodomonas_salina.4
MSAQGVRKIREHGVHASSAHVCPKSVHSVSAKSGEWEGMRWGHDEKLSKEGEGEVGREVGREEAGT